MYKLIFDERWNLLAPILDGSVSYYLVRDFGLLCFQGKEKEKDTVVWVPP